MDRGRLEEGRRALEDATLRGPGHTAPALRQAIAKGSDIPEELRELVDKIQRHAFRVTDEEIAALKAKYSEDQIFEIVVSAALGASMRRLDIGLRALEEA